jgi:hypothetical protein
MHFGIFLISCLLSMRLSLFDSTSTATCTTPTVESSSQVSYNHDRSNEQMQETSPLLPNNSAEAHDGKLDSKRSIWQGLMALIFVGVVIGFVWFAIVKVFGTNSNSAIPTPKVPGKTLAVQVASVHFDKYLRFDQQGALLTEYIPWAGSSTMTVHFQSGTGCFKMQTSKTKWVSFDNNGKFAYVATSDEAETFEFHSPEGKSFSEPGDDVVTRINLCGRDQFWTVERESDLGSPNGQLVLALQPGTSRRLVGQSDDGITVATVTSDVKLFRVETVKPFHGVNLGGWFIPEIWMNPGFSNYTGLGWAGSLCK